MLDNPILFDIEKITVFNIKLFHIRNQEVGQFTHVTVCPKPHEEII